LSAKSRRSLCFYLVAGLWAALATSAVGCGYQAVYARPGSFHLSVGAGQILVPEVDAVQAALSGARAELAAAGRLAPASGYPRLAVDLLRVDEVSRGVHVQAGQPMASGMGVAVVVRGRVLLGPEQEATLDTGDVRRAVQLAGDADPRADSAVYDQAVRAAAERAGRAAARVAMGIPEPNDEAP
jgi:hypothetical protein